jgi:hypothetical protein
VIDGLADGFTYFYFNTSAIIGIVTIFVFFTLPIFLLPHGTSATVNVVATAVIVSRKS